MKMKYNMDMVEVFCGTQAKIDIKYHILKLQRISEQTISGALEYIFLE